MSWLHGSQSCLKLIKFELKFIIMAHRAPRKLDTSRFSSLRKLRRCNLMHGDKSKSDIGLSDSTAEHLSLLKVVILLGRNSSE